MFSAPATSNPTLKNRFRFSARLVEVDSGSLIGATSANRDMAMTNSSVIAHAASQDALKDLLSQLVK